MKSYIARHASGCSSDRDWMRLALLLAETAGAAGEVPVGALLVHHERGLLAAAYNGREQTKNALYHAEMAVIDAGCRALGGWRLPDCTLYVTLEPCPMCAGAIWNARIPRVVYGAKDSRAGAMGSVFAMQSYPLNWKPSVESGVLEDACRTVLQTFFRARRKKYGI